jgi:hypothetical protein
MKMQILVVSDWSMLIAAIKGTCIDNTRMDIHECVYEGGNFSAQPPYSDNFDAVIVNFSTVKKSSSAATTINARISTSNLIAVVSTSNGNKLSKVDEENDTLLPAVSSEVIVAASPESYIKDALLNQYHRSYTTIKKTSALCSELTADELLLLYHLQQGILDDKDLIEKTGKTVSQINRILSSIASKLNTRNSRANIIHAAFRSCGEIRRTRTGYLMEGIAP